MTIPKAALAAQKYELNPKVAMPVIAGALVNILIGPLAQYTQIDLTGYTADLTLVIMGAVGYLTPAK